MCETLEILRGARVRIAAGWVQGHLGETSDGRPCSGYDEDAVAFCAVGAIQGAIDMWRTGSWRSQLELKEALAPCIVALVKAIPGYISPTRTIEWLWGWNSVVDYNNSHTKEEVLAMFDHAIHDLESKEDPVFIKFKEDLAITKQPEVM